LYDKLYVEAADAPDGFGTTNDSPLQLSWMLGTGSVGHNYDNVSINSGSSSTSNILPASWALALNPADNGQVGATSVQVSDPNGVVAPWNAIFANTGKRLVKFTFNSDGSARRNGWSIKLRSVVGSPTEINPPYEGSTLEVGAPLYVRPEYDDNTQVQDFASDFRIGYCVSPVDNGMAKIYRPIGG
jgi:hypothetical protein